MAWYIRLFDKIFSFFIEGEVEGNNRPTNSTNKRRKEYKREGPY